MVNSDEFHNASRDDDSHSRPTHRSDTDGELITFTDRERTVFTDVLTWIHKNDLEEHTGSTIHSESRIPADETLKSLIASLEATNAITPGILSPQQVKNCLELYADQLQELAWDIDDPEPMFQFYEDVFKSIEEKFTQQENGYNHEYPDGF